MFITDSVGNTENQRQILWSASLWDGQSTRGSSTLRLSCCHNPMHSLIVNENAGWTPLPAHGEPAEVGVQGTPGSCGAPPREVPTLCLLLLPKGSCFPASHSWFYFIFIGSMNSHYVPQRFGLRNKTCYYEPKYEPQEMIPNP